MAGEADILPSTSLPEAEAPTRDGATDGQDEPALPDPGLDPGRPGHPGRTVTTALHALELQSLNLNNAETPAAHTTLRASTQTDSPSLLALPPELLDTILSYLTPTELASVSRVCSKILEHSLSEIHWRHHVLSNLPGRKIASPHPCKTWKELFMSHDPHWFLTKYKIWFCDRELTGQMIIARYDERRGCIEGYLILAVSRKTGDMETWASNPSIQVHPFDPRVKLHLDRPVFQFQLSQQDEAHNLTSEAPSTRRRFRSEQSVPVYSPEDPRKGEFLLARPMKCQLADDAKSKQFPYDHMWPPPAIPARSRVAGRATSIHRYGLVRDKPPSMWGGVSRSEATDQVFHIRQWMNLGQRVITPPIDELISYATLDPALYTPTTEKPWRGIWVGDYSGHGCEFLLVHQPDGPQEARQRPLTRRDGETENDFEARFLRERVHCGRIEAIKLTGDPNIPRGECTFIADDIGDTGLVRTSSDPPFEGARIVQSRGHVANIGFHHDEWMATELIMISHDRLAQHWVEFGHISYFQRVNIDNFLVPR